ncbi:protein of unknown function [Maridesulfovibrio hydrothermalis AM13 = DSM 14728]|uniref:Uncharacterized protein n=1 Tax=Maridesulfovibrio hydrothermalis AM13 = DSM 14728 TaxID=1121451 RepID=L0RFQ4_9BACT|nr:protein of unknown function [Maridesulfovibrio hydrothermalis AM13 = DSM 14728]
MVFKGVFTLFCENTFFLHYLLAGVIGLIVCVDLIRFNCDKSICEKYHQWLALCVQLLINIMP